MASTKVLELRIHSASNLRNVAWFGMNQDPYVLVRSLPSGAEAKTLSIWGGGVNPKFDAEKHQSRLVMRVPEADGSLVFEVKNKNVVQDELIASGVLDMGVVMDEGPAVQPVELPLHTGGGTLSCTVFKKALARAGRDEDRDLEEAIARSMGESAGSGGSGGGGGGGGDFDWTGGLGAAFSGGSAGDGGGNVLGGTQLTRDMSADEKRRAAAEAAEARQKNWRQGGAAGGNPKDQAALAERRRKDELVGKIEALYKARGEDAPFGLGGSSVDALNRHLQSLQSSTSAAAARQQKEQRLQAAAGLR
jgi:hypothetical protein